ncbi:MAG: MoxR family ATPase [Bdellovibrionales bacterium]
MVAVVETCAKRLQQAREEIEGIVFGQDEVVRLTTMALLSGGHALLIGVPGLAKTKLVETIATVMGLETRRIQCTPDLMPADILGSEVLDEDEKGRRSFRFIHGPVFAQLLMADEINRASPRTQSALLQAMQELRVTIAGKNYPLPAPFHVLATQNPLEQEGTYPLPEAQLDRFLMQIDVGYPDLESERRMLLSTTSGAKAMPRPVISATELRDAQELVRRMPIGESVVAGLLKLVRNVRPETSALPLIQKCVAWGPGPRASQALSLASRARALLDGRLSPSLDDVKALAHPALRHRMALSFSARAEGVTIAQVIDEALRDLDEN